MKKFLILFFAVFVGVVLLLSCNRVEYAVPTDTGDSFLTVSIATGDTKASGQGAEDTLRDVQLLMFNGKILYRYYRFSYDEIKAKRAIISDLGQGDYNVFALVNGPSIKDSVENYDDLKHISIELSKYNIPSGDGSGFVMSAESAARVRAGANDLVLNLERYVGRVAITEIVNNIPPVYGTILLKNVFLMNVVGTTVLEGTYTPLVSQWYNKEGRVDENPRVESHIINGVDRRASAEALTFSPIADSLSVGASFKDTRYSYAYTNTASNNPDGFHPDFQPQRTTLVVVAEVAGVTYYYSIPLSSAISIARNHTTNIKLTILGPGSTDPAVIVDKKNLIVELNVVPWEVGGTYNPEI